MNNKKPDAPEKLSGFDLLINEIRTLKQKRIHPRTPLPRPFSQPATHPASKEKKSSPWDELP